MTIGRNEKTGLCVSNDGSQRANDGSGKWRGRPPRFGGWPPASARSSHKITHGVMALPLAIFSGLGSVLLARVAHTGMPVAYHGQQNPPFGGDLGGLPPLYHLQSIVLVVVQDSLEEVGVRRLMVADV